MSFPVSRLQAALASATQETTLALASLNFDFSLVKVEPPAEFKDVGASLTKERRAAAESGSVHVLARRLASLFESIIPPIPNLIPAYGLRSSEISKSMTENTKQSQFLGPFKDFMGIDGTTIWAAATSGSGAVAVHLLACMLARFWSPSEALSIWEELVSERKKELASNADSAFVNLKDVAATELVITKAQLSEWDASARAWLRAADEAETTQKRQKQLMLILGNIHLPVNHDLRVYQSVTKAWTMALKTMNDLLKGGSYSVQDGAILVALSAWHLYPDMVILGQMNQEIKQRDKLIPPGAILTIGLTGIDTDPSDDGVHWSLSLAHLRYYGGPVSTSRSVRSFGRFTIKQFVLVILGCVFGSWGIHIRQLPDAIKLILSIGRQVDLELETWEPSQLKTHIKDDSWIKMLVGAAQDFDGSTGEEREICKKLLHLGFRQSRFLTDGRTDVFGLRSGSLFHLIADQEEQVAFIRRVMSRWSSDSAIIRIVEPSGSNKIYQRIRHELPDSDLEFSQFVSVRKVHPTQNSNSGYFRWVATKAGPDGQSFSPDTPIPDQPKEDEFSFIDAENIVEEAGGNSFRWYNPPSILVGPDVAEELVKAEAEKIMSPESMNARNWYGFKERNQWMLSSNTKQDTKGRGFKSVEVKDADSVKEDNFQDEEDAHQSHRVDHVSAKTVMDMSAGNSNPSTLVQRCIPFQFCRGNSRVGLYQYPVDSWPDASEHYERQTRKLELKTINEYLEKGLLDRKLLLRHLAQLENKSDVEYKMLIALRGVASCVSIYSSLPGSTISPGILSLVNSLWRMKWLVSAYESVAVHDGQIAQEIQYQTLLPLKMSRHDTFACITMLESGGFDLHPSQMERVMAISIENSLYVAAPLLCDPLTSLDTNEVRRVFGNVGRAGIALLIPPHDPNIREPRPEMWEVVTHADFDGNLDDCFQSTSLHLRFSGYELPIVMSKHGGRFTEVFFLESVVSVHESGKWVADLDVLRALESPKLRRVVKRPDCVPQAAGHKPSFGVVSSIDCWEELLEKPTNEAVVRAHGNWQARLAAAAISVQLGHITVLFGSHGCWDCGYDTLQSGIHQWMKDLAVKKKQHRTMPSRLELSDQDTDEEDETQAALMEYLKTAFFIL